jgi:hypothetical protein
VTRLRGRAKLAIFRAMRVDTSVLSLSTSSLLLAGLLLRLAR